MDAPDRERESRPDTERRDLEDWADWADWEDVRELRELERELPLPADPLPPPVIPVGSEPTSPFPACRTDAAPDVATTGARPQVSQYSSPPPTSSYLPSQPGR
ncbi:hypothetical protein ACWD5V_09730 [Streptomyces sp. NPDC002523]